MGELDLLRVAHHFGCMWAFVALCWRQRVSVVQADLQLQTQQILLPQPLEWLGVLMAYTVVYGVFLQPSWRDSPSLHH